MRLATRNTLLGSALAALALGSLAAFVQLAARSPISPLSPSLTYLGYALRLVAFLVIAAGLTVLALCLLAPKLRERGWRLGALVAAAGWAALFLSDLAGTILTLSRAVEPPILSVGFVVSHVLLLAANLWIVGAFVIVAPLFSASPSATGPPDRRRNGRLGWVMLGFAVVFALGTINALVTGWRAWDSIFGWAGVRVQPAWDLRPDLAAGIFAFLAAAIAGMAFRAAARSHEKNLLEVLRRREARLAAGALSLLVSSILFAMMLVPTGSGSEGFDVLYVVVLVVAPLLVVIGFGLSRRSLGGRDEPMR